MIISGSEDKAIGVINELTDVNYLDRAGSASPLSLAIARGMRTVVAALLSKGADPLAVDIWGNLLLHTAIRNAWRPAPTLRSEVIDCVRMTLEKARQSGRLPSKSSLDARLAFYKAGYANPELLKLFLEHEADPNLRDKDGYLFDRAVREKNPEIIRLLVGAKTDISQTELDTKAYDALANHNVQLLEAFRSVGADPERHAKNNREAIFDAVCPERSIDVLEFVLKSGANPNAVKPENRSAPIFSTGFDPEKIRLLIKHGADSNFKDNGYTLLAKVLFYYGKEISVISSEVPGKAPRIYSKVSLVNLLLDHGADLNANNGGWGQWGALGLTRREDKEVIDLLIKRGATLSHEIGGLTLLPQLRDKYGDATPSDNAPGPITIAVDILERDDLALVLIARDGKVGPKDRLALLQATRRGWRDVAQALLRAGADPNIGDAGLTPLAMAERRRDKLLITMLVAAGAKPPPQPAPRYKIDAGGEFETTVATEIDDIIFLDPPRFYLGRPEEASFALYGKGFNQFEQIKCEHSVTFSIIANAGIAGGISAGVCSQEAKRLRKLAPNAKQGIETLFDQLVKGGMKTDQLELRKLGWIYEKNAGPNRSEIYYFPVIVIGHGILSAPTVVLVSKKGDQAIIIQADVMNLCGEGRHMQNQTVLCSDTKSALIDIAQRLFARFQPSHTSNDHHGDILGSQSRLENYTDREDIYTVLSRDNLSTERSS